MSYSKYYYEELDSQAQERYIDKCTMAGLLTDPFPICQRILLVGGLTSRNFGLI